MNDVAEFTEQPESKLSPVAAVLERAANARDVRLLFSHGLIDDLGRREALRLLHGPLDWWRWIERALLFLGLVLVLAGVICFFAWNWAALNPFIKLGLIEAAILVCCGVAWWRGLDSMLGHAAQLAGAVFVGVFLAVYGQIYQTGADAYELFVGWALLILPWVALAQFAGLWLFWIGLVNVGLVLAFDQVLRARGFDWGYIAVALAVINGGFAALRELGWRQRWPWLQDHWIRWLLVPATLVPLMISVVELIFDGPGQNSGRLAATGMLAVALPIVAWYFRSSAPDLLSLTYAVTCVCVLLDLVIGRVLFAELKIDEIGGFLLMGLVVVGTVSGATMWLLKELRRQRTNPKRDSSGPTDLASVARGLLHHETPNNRLVVQKPASHQGKLGGVGEPHPPTVGQLLAELQAVNRFAAAGIDQAAILLLHDADDETPWFVSVMVGFGAWVACLCFLVCLGIAGAFNNQGTMSVFGFVVTALATMLHRLSPNLFSRQFALAAGLTGYVMVLVAFGERNLMPAAMVSVVLSLGIYPLYPSLVFRFLLTCAPQLMFVMASWDWRWQNGQNSADVIHGLVLVQTAGVGAIFAWRPKQILWPAGYGLAAGLLATLLLTTGEFHQMTAWPSSVIQVAAEIWLIAWLMSAGQRRNPTLILLSAIACVVIGILSAPGVLAAVGILLLGHLERDNLLRSLGLLFLPVYLVMFYYDLNTSLLLKSGMLVGSGLMLWLACMFARRQLTQSEPLTVEEAVA